MLLSLVKCSSHR